MIALNEIISKKEQFINTYKLMNKKVNLDKIEKLEIEFTKKDKENNVLRSTCNKLCSEVAELVNTNKDTKNIISKINSLDKAITKNDKNLKKEYLKINKLIKKLPNLAIGNNVLSKQIKTKNDENYNIESFIAFIKTIAKTESTNLSLNGYLKSIKNYVFKSNSVPKIILSKKYILIFNIEINETLKSIIDELKQHSKYMIDKSICYLNKISSKELYTYFNDTKKIIIKLIGEYLSREYMIKVYDEKFDMTRFANIILINL